MTEQTKAQRLADTLDMHELHRAATELLRLDANEAALVDALNAVLMSTAETNPMQGDEARDPWAITNAMALITRIEAERNAK